jgi:hypothetical protein
MFDSCSFSRGALLRSMSIFAALEPEYRRCGEVALYPCKEEILETAETVFLLS